MITGQFQYLFDVPMPCYMKFKTFILTLYNTSATLWKNVPGEFIIKNNRHNTPKFYLSI
jgi:hypothetical protein